MSTAFAIFFIFEVLRVIFFVPIRGLSEAYYHLYYILILAAIDVVAFLLAREIINFQSPSTYDVSANNDTISYVSLSSTRHGLYKLFVFSFLIMGTPLFLLSIQLHYMGRSDIAYQFFIVILVMDVIRMFILTFIISRYTLKSISRIR
jgi:hypothetical protein